MNNADTITRLQTYISKLKNQQSNPPERRQSNLKEYLAWLKLEIDRTEISIARLK